jgi:branched-chain amino acid transport system substrate-binding protein
MKSKQRRRKLVLPLAALAVAGLIATSVSLASPGVAASEIRVAIMTDCKGAFGFGYEIDIGGAQAALAQFAGGKVKNPKKPSAGMTGIKVAGKNVRIVGYGCGDDTPATGLRETRRLMEQLRADIMIGPLSGDEAVAVANYAKTHRTKTFVIGTAGSQDPTLQIAPPNVFRYHGDGAQWNAGLGEIVYKRLGWRRAAIIMDDYSFGWTSGAGIIADFCAVGGQITRRVFPPLNTQDFAQYVRQLPPPNAIDGYFWVVGGTATGAALKAFEQAYGPLDAKKHAGNLFFAFLGNFQEVAPRLVGAYVGGFGTGPGLKTAQARAYERVVHKHYPGLNGGNYADGFVYNYYNAAWATVLGLRTAGGDLTKLQASMPKSLKSGYEVSDGGTVRLDANRQAIQDQYPLQIVRGADGNPSLSVVGYVPNVDQSFGGLFKKTSPAPGRTQPACRRLKTPWQGKIKVVRNGVVTNQVIR